MPDAADTSGGSPLTDAELAAIAERAFRSLASVVLAVSGGADSIALLLLIERWHAGSAAAARTPTIVATVDHGLRAGSADEAAWVAQRSTELGLAHHTLLWTGGKPVTGTQEAARAARYRLLAGLIDRLELPRPAGIVMAHHLDDLAETFLMRLARGSGLDGLAAMAAERSLPEPGGGDGVRLLRPFLEIPHARLAATLAARGRAWLEDPSNADPRFERVRVRKALGELAGVGVRAQAIARSARRLARARTALESLTDGLARRVLQCHDGAYGEIDATQFDTTPEELRLRLLQRVVRRFGSGNVTPRMTQLEALVLRLAGAGPTVATLAGCRLERQRQQILAVREPGRQGLPEIELRPGETRMWDNRFVVSAAGGLAGPVTVRAIPAATLSRLVAERRAGSRTDVPLPRAAALTLPSFWAGSELLAIPHPLMAYGTERWRHALAARPAGRESDPL